MADPPVLSISSDNFKECPDLSEHRLTRPSLQYTPEQLGEIGENLIKRKELFGDDDMSPPMNVEAVLEQPDLEQVFSLWKVSEDDRSSTQKLHCQNV